MFLKSFSTNILKFLKVWKACDYDFKKYIYVFLE